MYPFIFNLLPFYFLPQVKRFLVIDTHQLILVEPDNAPGRLGQLKTTSNCATNKLKPCLNLSICELYLYNGQIDDNQKCDLVDPGANSYYKIEFKKINSLISRNIGRYLLGPLFSVYTFLAFKLPAFFLILILICPMFQGMVSSSLWLHCSVLTPGQTKTIIVTCSSLLRRADLTTSPLEPSQFCGYSPDQFSRFIYIMPFVMLFRAKKMP